MKTKLKQNLKNNEKGGGHQARIACNAEGSIEIDGQKQQFKFNYDVTITIEHIDYVVKLAAGRLARVFDQVATDGIPKRESVTA